MKRIVQAASLLFEVLAPSVADSAGVDTEEMCITHQTNGVTSTEQEICHVQKAVLLDETAIASAEAQKNPTSGYSQIEISFTDKGRRLFSDTTRQNTGRQIAIVVDGNLLSAPSVMAEISGGKATIAGQFTEEEARSIAARINTAIHK